VICRASHSSDALSPRTTTAVAGRGPEPRTQTRHQSSPSAQRTYRWQQSLQRDFAEIGGKNSAQVRLAKDDHLIQTLAAQCADQTFSIAILPTARLVATASLRGQKIDARGTIIWNPTSTLEGGSSSLYETSDGAFFLVRKIKEECYAEPDFIGRLPYLNDPGLYPLTRKQAWHGRKAKSLTPTKLKRCSAK
jgi:hypothetical protein